MLMNMNSTLEKRGWARLRFLAVLLCCLGVTLAQRGENCVNFKIKGFPAGFNPDVDCGPPGQSRLLVGVRNNFD